MVNRSDTLVYSASPSVLLSATGEQKGETGRQCYLSALLDKDLVDRYILMCVYRAERDAECSIGLSKIMTNNLCYSSLAKNERFSRMK